MNHTPPLALVTGAAGFAGSHLVQHLAASNEVVAWTRTQPCPAVRGMARWQQVDLLNRTQVREALRALRPTAVYHCAGVAHAAEPPGNMARLLAGNVLATHHLLDGLHTGGLACRVLVPGSALVYAASWTPIDEEDALAPATPYALSKLAQELLARRAVGEDGVQVVLTRSFNHTGARQSAAFAAPGIARQIALSEIGQCPPIVHVGNLEAVRDILDVRDVVDAYVGLMAAGVPGAVYNVASGVGHTIRALLEGLVARARVPVRIEEDASRLRPNDVPALVGSPARLRIATGWQPRIPFDRMLDDLLDYWRRAVST